MTRRMVATTLVFLLILAAGAVLLLILSTPPREPDPQTVQPTRTPRPRVTPLPPGATTVLGSGAVITAPLYEIAFTAPQYPDHPDQHEDGLDQRLVALIDRATKTVDLAVYDFDLENVAHAMATAVKRGVRVRMVTDTDTVNNTKDADIQLALKTVRDAKIPIVEDKRGAIMHHKFTIVDSEWVSTGSWNYTDGDTYRLNNWMGVFQSKEMVGNFTTEFEQLFAGTFGPNKKQSAAHGNFRLGDTRIQTCFSPPGKCDDLIVTTIRQQAKKSLQFLAFSFTHDDIGDVIIERAKAGVKTAGVFENTGSQTTFSEFGKMQTAGLDVATDGNPYSMHHKVIIIDERIVIAGSFNFSANATTANDENLLIIEDPAVAAGFQKEFAAIQNIARNPPPKWD